MLTVEDLKRMLKSFVLIEYRGLKRCGDWVVELARFYWYGAKHTYELLRRLKNAVC